MDNPGTETGNCPMRLQVRRDWHASLHSWWKTLGGECHLLSVEIFNVETGELVHGPDLPQYHNITAATVNNELLVFTKRLEGDDIGKIHTLEQGQPNSTWETTASTLPADRFVYKPIVIGDCVLLTPTSVYDTKRACLWNLPSIPFSTSRYYGGDWTLVGETDIVVFATEGIYSLKLKLDAQPLTATVLRHTKTMFGSILFSPDFSDVTFVCPDGIEIRAHRVVLASKNPYFQAYFSGPWTEQHPDGRWETEKSSDVIKALLSLIYIGESSSDLSDAHLLELLETVYEFELVDDLLRVCQALCMENITLFNVTDLLLSAKRLEASFLFDACLKFVSDHFLKLVANHSLAMDIINYDGGQLWQEIVESAEKSNRTRPRDA